MSVVEIVFGILMAVLCVGIIVLTAAQVSRGQGLSGSINGNYGMMGTGRVSHADAMMAKITKIAGVVLVVVCIIASTVTSRLS